LNSEVKSDCDVLTHFITKEAPGVELISSGGKEFVFQLPQGFSLLPQFLRALCKMRQNLAINSYGISMTTLEDVFLCIAQEEQQTRL